MCRADTKVWLARLGIWWDGGYMHGGMLSICMVECWVYAWLNVGYMHAEMLGIRMVECWVYAWWNVGYMHGGMLGIWWMWSIDNIPSLWRGGIFEQRT